MKVSELIEKLKECNPEAVVYHDVGAVDAFIGDVMQWSEDSVELIGYGED